MAKVVISPIGSKEYYNSDGKKHREDGPAFITREGTKIWYKNGLIDNQNGPASFNYAGIYGWSTLSNRYRLNGPTWEFPNGYKAWYDKEFRSWPKLK